MENFNMKNFNMKNLFWIMSICIVVLENSPWLPSYIGKLYKSNLIVRFLYFYAMTYTMEIEHQVLGKTPLYGAIIMMVMCEALILIGRKYYAEDMTGVKSLLDIFNKAEKDVEEDLDVQVVAE